MKGAASGLPRLLDFYENLSPESLVRLPALYAPNAAFKDPFNDVRGLEAIGRVFRHMYRQVQEPRFRITSSMAAGDEAWIEWEFRFRFYAWHADEIQLVRGATRLRFTSDGRVSEHRDYWDSGEELFAKLPLLGSLMRFLRRRLAAR